MLENCGRDLRLETTHVLTEVGDKQGHALRRNFAPKMYGPMKNKVKKKTTIKMGIPCFPNYLHQKGSVYTLTFAVFPLTFWLTGRCLNFLKITVLKAV